MYVPNEQEEEGSSRHVPPLMQQAPFVPVAQGSGVHVVPSPWKVPPPIPHATTVVRLQVPKMQQAPSVLQGFGEQIVAAPSQTLGEVQADSAVREQESVMVQQAPVGCVHGFGVHVVLAPCQVLGEAQAACVVTVQVPATAQQAPVG
jgi:hypothetical protein